MVERKMRNNEAIDVGIMYLPHYRGLPPIKSMTGGSSGFDINAACKDEVVVSPGKVVLVPAGFKLSIPPGYEAQLRPRSGLALKNRISVLNSPGTIDSDYRGEIGVILYNFGEEEFIVHRGERIAQLVFNRLPSVRLVEFQNLDTTERGAGGFGHTG
jgi:dUTP pyrophosphatase